MKMTYEDARKFITEASKKGSVLGLANIKRLMQALGDVQDMLPVIHIAGTNGKGSVGAYLASIFQKAGLHVGRYCSPAVFDPLEVWQYDGQKITPDEYAGVMSQVKKACDIVVSIGYEMPTAFEIETAAAFVWCFQKKVDILLLETGMGGETDATNIIKKPLVSVITTIGRDHMQFLGDRIEEIAAVKAGIIKKGCPVVSAPQKTEVEHVLRGFALRRKTEITFVDASKIVPLHEEPGRLELNYTLSQEEQTLHLCTSMSGGYQKVNAALAAETAAMLLPELLSEKEVHANHTPILDGIREARWQGRFEVLGERPLFVIDGAHNEDAALELAKTVQNCFTNMPLTYIIGVLADKEHEKMLQTMLPYASRVYTVTPLNPRALAAEMLAEEARQFHTDVTPCDSIALAVRNALRHGDTVLAFGSLSYLGELRTSYEHFIAKTDESRKEND